jgi:hypothetical protein
MRRRPAYEVGLGFIKVRVWFKRTKSAPQHTITVTRLFRNGAEWKESSRFGPDDIPTLNLLLDRALNWIVSASDDRPS